MKKIHLIIENTTLTTCVEKVLRKEYIISSSKSVVDGLEFLRTDRNDFLLIDIDILKQASAATSYKTVFQAFWLISPNLDIIVMSDKTSFKEAVKAVNQGADSYLKYPLVSEELKSAVSCDLNRQPHSEYTGEHFRYENEFDFVLTENPSMQRVFESILAVASTKSTVLLFGETGTGKGLAARFIHKLSSRKDRPFVEVHCGAIPDTLVESELFGHERGAFTGAVKRKQGKFDIARKGTIFFDEIGTITPSVQIKLLQVLQDGLYHRLGGEQEIYSDARLIAATNTNLKKLCEDGGFRNDLYYRLNVFPLEIPPLRARKEDIPRLTRFFLDKLNTSHLKKIHDIHSQVMDAFLSYSWPGNIRELENIMERAYILEKSSVLLPENFPTDIFGNHRGMDSDLSLAEVKKREIGIIERRYLDRLLKKHRGRINMTAKAAGITSRHLNKLMTRHNLHKEDYISKI